MELRHIRYFLAVAEERNFTRAAARIGIGQPPLSQQIKDLESEVGAQLFRRVPHGAELTTAGQAFLENVQTIPMQAEKAMKAAQRGARGELGALRIGMTGSAIFNPAVPAAIRSFRRAYPAVELTLEESNTTRLGAGIRDGDFDTAFLRPGSVGSEGLQFRLVSEESMVAVLPAQHPAAASGAVDLRSLRGDAFVMTPRAVGPTLFDTVVSACRRVGFEPMLGQSAPQISSVVTLVAAELGVSVVPASMAQLQVNGVVYRPIEGKTPVTRLTLAYRRGETSILVRNFIAHALSTRTSG
ncbi:DNA-binding transcriptional LysR family regulator [Variovorax boronicumulans]|uniref:LysR family transcriptional regulator n=1 Tax=Variovorax boronicumulans TaxID=436515 RepID=UPI00278466A6|nr:LysR family transcriptional regulator [Variovorax boronicumulans]MDQ0083866.1 DNA-binding transcriptional LysR family regulator [Variovorax boronicumulans]